MKTRQQLRNAARAATLPLLMAAAGVATADVITFSGLDHGEIVSNQISGVDIRADNVGGGPDLAIIFDSMRTGTADPDLEDAWDGGNLPSFMPLGNLLIIAENAVDNNNDGLIDSPDDEGSRPAGTLTFDFDFDLSAIGFDLIDIESVQAEPGKVVTATTASGAIGQVLFSDLEGVNGVTFGNNSANRIIPLAATDFGFSSGTTFSSVTFNFGGSGALDNINYVRAPVATVASVTSVPAPAAATLGLLAAGFLALRRRAS